MEAYSGDPIFLTIFTQVAKFFKDDEKKVIRWFFTKNPQLGEIRPIEMVMLGRTQKLLDFILNARKENGW